MFTGIISAIGEVRESDPDGRGRSLGILLAEPATAAALATGASVAVNGCCLTVLEVADGCFRLEAVPETLERTNLGDLKPQMMVNLELPLRMAGRLDGHLLQGHVDGTTRVREVREVDAGREVTLDLPPRLAPYVAEKGSIGVDGMSLTVAAVDAPPGTFKVALIPHTLTVTIADGYGPGSLVNLEVDVIARYVQRLLQSSGRGI